MITPDFVKDDTQKKYKFLLRSDFKIGINLGGASAARQYLFYFDGALLAEIKNGELTIFKGFRWDGCSPSVIFGINGFSIPSPESTAAASLCHDLFYQFLSVEGCPWSREWADSMFKKLLEINKFDGAWIYFRAVRSLGGFFVASKDSGRVRCLIKTKK